MKIYTKITDGQMTDYAQVALVAELGKHEGKDIELSINRKRRIRSISQNKYYWSVVIPAIRAMLEEYGNEVDDEETHSFLKEHVGKLTSSVVDSVGRRLAVVKSSASLTTAEFEAYLLRVTAWAAQENVIIPTPNQHLEPPLETYNG